MATLGIYARVSTDDQRKNGISLPEQIKRGENAASRYGYDSYLVFEDGGLSGSLDIEQRPQLKRLVNEIHNGRIQGLFVTDINRLARNHLVIEALKIVIKTNNVKLYTLGGEIDLHNVNVELMTDLSSIINAFFLKQSSAQIKVVLEGNIRDGKVSGGPFQPFGYTKDENKMLIVNEKEADVVKWIYEQALNNIGSKVIANTLNNQGIPTKRHGVKKGGQMTVKGVVKQASDFKWRDKTVLGILKNPIYKGKRLYKGKHYDCPAIVTEGTWQAVQEAIQTRNQFKDTTNKYQYLLKGLIRCGRCGKGFYGRKRADNHDNAYICVSKRHKGEFCGTRGVNIDYLNDLVWDCVKNMDKDIVRFYKQYEEENNLKFERHVLKLLKEEEERLESEMSNMIRLSNSGKMDDRILFKEMNRVQAEFEKVKSGIEHGEKSLRCLEEKDGIIEMVKMHIVIAKKQRIAFEEKQKLVRTFVNWVDVRWDEGLKTHIIAVDLKVDGLTQHKLSNEYTVHYKKNGWRLNHAKVFKSSIAVSTIRDNEINAVSVVVDGKDSYLPLQPRNFKTPD